MTANRTLLLIGLITPLTLGPALGADDQPARDGPVPQETPATPEIEHALPIGPGGLLPAAAADHPVGAEDLLEISVFEIPELNRTVRVSERGTISLPLLGEMEVRGLTAMQVEDKLRDALTQKYLQDPQVCAGVDGHHGRRIGPSRAIQLLRAAREFATRRQLRDHNRRIRKSGRSVRGPRGRFAHR